MDLEFAQTLLPKFLHGYALTLVLVAVSGALGAALALPLALARMAERRFIRGPAYGYIFFMRGTPLIVQMFMIYFGLGQFPGVRQSFLWPVLRDPLNCALISLTLNEAAYIAEILRGAMAAVPRGIIEAARSSGLGRWQTLRLVTLPIALRTALPALGNEAVLLMKSTAICFTITVRDLMGEANIVRAQTFRTYEPLITAGLLYLLLTFAIVRAFGYLERRTSLVRAMARQAKAVGAETKPLAIGPR